MNELEILQKLKGWAQENESVRAFILTSSRVASSSSPTDVFSDYDVAIYVDSLKNFSNDDWLNAFGDVLVKWPEKPQTTHSKDWITRLVLFENRLRIDFQITFKTDILPTDYDLGYQVIVDKDGFTKDFPQATETQHLIKRPSEEEFLTLINGFFWDATYIPKYLWRDNLYFAKFMFAQLHFEYLEKMIEWYIGSQYDWSVSTKLHGVYFEKYLDKETWEEIRKTFVGPGIEENWEAFFKLNGVFTKFARSIAEKLSYKYPQEQEEKMNLYFRKSKDLKN